MVKNKKIIVVGGSSGIGLSVSKALAEKGAKVTIASRSMENLNNSRNFVGLNVSIKQLDASVEKSVVEFFKEFGNFDHLVVTIRPGQVLNELSKSNVEDSKAAFNTKFWGQYNLTKHCLPYISQSGSITLTSGIASQRGYRGFSATAAINGAIESFVKSVAGEISPIRINAVSPGFIETANSNDERYNLVKQLGAKIPLNRLGSKDEVSEAFIYLINSNYSTGTSLIVDGGELSV